MPLVNPWPFRAKGYCCCLRLSVHPSIHTSVCLYKLLLVCMITHHRFVMESPNLNQMCIMGYLLSAGIEYRGHCYFGHFDSEFKEIWLVHMIDNSSQIWTGITKFAPKMHPTFHLYLERGSLTLIFKVMWAFLIPRNSIQHHSCILICAGQGVFHIPNMLLYSIQWWFWWIQ